MVISFISKKEIPKDESVSAKHIKEGVFDFITQKHPGFDRSCFVSIHELNHLRRLYFLNLINETKSEEYHVDKEVLLSIENDSFLTQQIKDETKDGLSIGQKLADKIAVFGGSWAFIISFFSFIMLWMLVNIWILASKPFDPFPFILLNLILSCLAAIQAPIIMMSQNRQEQKDRQRSEQDFKINLKAEFEIKIMHDKMDHLYSQLGKTIMMQELQTDYLEDLISEIKKK